jgi:uncharacterized membrane protein (DUF485 family)
VKTAREILDSPDFRRLVRRRWTIALALTAALFASYYGYILLVALDKPFLARRIGDGATTLGIPIGVAVIVISWALTAAYVVWANRSYDREVERLKRELDGP